MDVVKICIIDSKLMVGTEDYSFKLSEYLNNIGKEYGIVFMCSAYHKDYDNFKNECSVLFLHQTDFKSLVYDMNKECSLGKRYLIWTSTDPPKLDGSEDDFYIKGIIVKHYNDYKNLNWHDALNEWSKIIIRRDIIHNFPIEVLTQQKETDYLLALYFLCQGYLIVYLMHEYGRKKSYPQESEKIIKKLENLGLINPLLDEFINNLIVKYDVITKRNYWKDVFSNNTEFVNKITDEWKGLTYQKVPKIFLDFFHFLESSEEDPKFDLVDQLYNEMSINLRTKL